jgi:8-oxo-dGTP pyrophosphatase MutT (NUDIX family)
MSHVTAAGPHARGHRQYGAVPFMVDAAGRVRVALLTSRETRRWVIPKGWPITNLTGAEVASREAIEEAGLSGVVAASKPAGRYSYAKRLSTGETINCQVEVYLLHVQAELDAWPEMAQRVRAWFSPQIAATLVAERALAKILLGLPTNLPAVAGGGA